MKYIWEVAKGQVGKIYKKAIQLASRERKREKENKNEQIDKPLLFCVTFF